MAHSLPLWIGFLIPLAMVLLMAVLPGLILAAKGGPLETHRTEPYSVHPVDRARMERNSRGVA